MPQHLYSGTVYRPSIAHEHSNQGSFPGTVSTENKATLTALHLPIDIVQNFSTGQKDLSIFNINRIHGTVY